MHCLVDKAVKLRPAIEFGMSPGRVANAALNERQEQTILQEPRAT